MIRSAERWRRLSRRVSVLESARPSPIATASPIAAAVSSALRTSLTAVETSVTLRCATTTPTGSLSLYTGIAYSSSSSLNSTSEEPSRSAR